MPDRIQTIRYQAFLNRQPKNADRVAVHKE